MALSPDLLRFILIVLLGIAGFLSKPSLCWIHHNVPLYNSRPTFSMDRKASSTMKPTLLSSSSSSCQKWNPSSQRQHCRLGATIDDNKSSVPDTFSKMNDDRPNQQQQEQQIRTLMTGIEGRDTSVQPNFSQTTMMSLSSSEDDENGLVDLPFDDDAWEAYEVSVAEMMARPRVVKNARPDVILRCKEFLLSRKGIPPLTVPTSLFSSSSSSSKQHLMSHTNHTNNNVNDHDKDRRVVLSTLQHQQALRFQEHYNLTSKAHELVSRCLVYMGDSCAGTCVRHPIIVAWYKMKEMGLKPRENAVSTYMYILSTPTPSATTTTTTTTKELNQNRTESYTTTNDDGRPSNKKNNDADVSTFDVVDNTLLELATCHDLWYEPNEKTVTIRLMGLVDRGEIGTAENILASLGENVRRLRTFMPLMEYYCSQENSSSSILRLFRQMQNSPRVHWDSDSYALVLASLARSGHFVHNSTIPNQHQQPIRPIDGAHEANFSNTHGPELLDELLTEMAHDLLELSESAVMVLTDGFHNGFVGTLANNDDPDKDVMVGESPPGNVIIQKVKIPSNGICPLTGVKLRLLSLDDIQRQHVHDNLLEMARLQSQKFVSDGKKFKEVAAQETEVGYEDLLRFSEWLDSREGDPFTAIVDGANVGYFGHARMHYSSVKIVVEKLLAMGERPLVVIPHKYVRPKFRVKNDRTQRLWPKDREVIEWLDENGMLFVVPRLCLDDYYWMLGSVSNQTIARQHEDLTVPIGDFQGRFPGMRPMLVTNDKMRDHKLDLLGPREFRRWCSCHIVNYNVSAYEGDEWSITREVRFSPADFYSREIQGNPLQSGKGNVWHFPVRNMEETDWLCLYIAR